MIMAAAVDVNLQEHANAVLAVPINIREAFGCDLNIGFNEIERKIQTLENDYWFLGILMERFEDDYMQRDRISSLRDQTQQALNHLENMLARINNDDNSGTIVIGRPRRNVSKQNIIFLFELIHNWKIVATMLGISDRTLRRRRQSKRNLYKFDLTGIECSSPTDS